MLPPFGEGHSAYGNVGFPVTIKPHVEEKGCSANEHAGFQSQQNHMLKSNAILTKYYLFSCNICDVPAK